MLEHRRPALGGELAGLGRAHFVDRLREVAHDVEADSPAVPKLLDGEQETRVIAMPLGPPPKGYANWSLRLLARRVVELEVVDSVSHETIRRTLKKTT